MDIIQDTFEAALLNWRYHGVPDNPSAWLMQVAKNKAINAVKKESKIEKSTTIPEETIDAQFENYIDERRIRDSQLWLLMTCCHPDLSEKNQIIITLNIFCGFGIPEIANAIMMKNEAVKKAISRGKKVLKQSKSNILLQTNNHFVEKVEILLTILYLMFNEGYKTTRGKKGINHEMCYESIRITKLLTNDKHDYSAEANALLALMFFNIARFPARLGESNEWLTIEEQDRSLWLKPYIEEGFHYLNKATQSKKITKFHLQAIIASLHCSAPNFKSTDWKKITYLYQQMELVDPTFKVKLNRIIAESFVELDKSKKSIVELQSQLDKNNHLLYFIAQGHIFRRLGESENASYSYIKALEHAISPVDKNFLQKRINECKGKKYTHGKIT